MGQINSFRTSVLPRVLALILWVITLILGLYDIYFSREIFYSLYARFSTTPQPAVLMGNALIVVLAILYIGFVILTGEYHLKHVGKPESWKLFYQTFIVQLFIPFLAYFM